MYTCILFDIDGTLLDTEKAVQKLLLEEKEEKYLAEDLTFVLGYYGNYISEKAGIFWLIVK